MWKEVLTVIVADQLTFLAEKHQFLPRNLFGGRPGCTTTDAMHLLANTIETSWRAGKVTSVLFLDIEGAFPNAVPSRLVHNMRKRQVPRKITTFVQNMLEAHVTALKFNGYTLEPIDIDDGIGQGDPLSMVLYQFYNADPLDIPEGKKESAMAYVDDSLMIAMADTFQETHRILADMMGRKGGVAEWSTIHNSPLEYSKLALIDFAHRCSSKERPLLCLPQIEIPPSESTKYLGVIFDQHLDWKAQHTHAIGKGIKWISQLKRLTRPTWGITPNYARRLYISVAIPKVLYAADVWYVPLGSSSFNRKLAYLQRAGALAVTGGLRTSALDALDVGAHLLPASSLIDKWCHRALVRMATLPSDHPLSKIMRKKTAGKLKGHKAPINDLLAKYRYDPNKFEKIPAATRDPTTLGELPFTVNIAPDRDSSIRETENALEAVQVFTDGSATNGKVGAAAVLLRAGNPVRTLRFHLGPEKEHTVHEAELVGILLGMHLIKTEKHGSTTFALGVDNQAAIKAFGSDLRSPGHHLAREAIRIARRVHKRRSKERYSLVIRWTAGHEGIAGNEAADKEVRLAAEGKLQISLRSLPTSVSLYRLIPPQPKEP